MGFLPLLALAASYHACRKLTEDRRSALVAGAVIWGTAVVGFTEFPGAFERLTPLTAGALWLFFIAGALLLRRRFRGGMTAPGGNSFGAGDSLARAQLAAIVVLLVVALVLALLSAPTAADAMTYHLPRIEHWIQNRSVAFYITNIERQLWPGPGAEYIMLHLELLQGSDRLATVVQWGAFAGGIAVASLIARQLGASARGQAMAAFLAATTPGAVSQATGSQVELVFGFWLACAVSLGLRMLAGGRLDTAAAMLLGAAIGLAVFAKATAYIYFAPFGIWFLVASLRRGTAKAARFWIVAALAGIAIVAPHYYRNLDLYGSPLSQPGANGVVNSAFFPGGTLSNAVRNLSLHFGTPVPAINAAAESAVIAFDAMLGVAPDDERTTFPGERFRFIGRQSAEQTAGSPVQVILALAALVILVAARRKNALAAIYIGSVAAGFLLFCFYLRWQPWHARLHVPLLMLAAPACGLMLERVRSNAFLWGLSLVAFVFALPPLLRNPARPLVGDAPVYATPREDLYFAEHRDHELPYRAAAIHLEKLGCRSIGLWTPGDAAEYPLWTTLGGSGRKNVRIRHVAVENASARLEQIPSGERFTPCALLYLRSEGRWRSPSVPAGYSLTYDGEVIRIYARRAEAPQ